MGGARLGARCPSPTATNSRTRNVACEQNELGYFSASSVSMLDATARLSTATAAL
jgi:hypothetical protein